TTVTFTIDKTVPVVEGVENGAYYGDEVIPMFNEVTATLNGEPYVSGTPITEEGEYELVVMDEAGNQTTVIFTIDKTAPVVEGVTDRASYNSDVTVTFNEGTATLNGEPFTSGETVTDDGNYRLIVTDEAGNQTVVDFTVERMVPDTT